MSARTGRDEHRRAHGRQPLRHVVDEWQPVDVEQRLVAAHATAGAAGKHQSGQVVTHVTIIAGTGHRRAQPSGRPPGIVSVVAVR